jgi:hypothetical protein
MFFYNSGIVLTSVSDPETNLDPHSIGHLDPDSDLHPNADPDPDQEV